jgi:hypothetical protein
MPQAINFFPQPWGTQTVTYTLITKGCSTTFNRQTVVRGLPDPGFSGLLPAYCKGDPSSVLVPINTGGQFYGGNVSGNQFNPVDTGNFQVSYSVSLLGCADTLTRTTRVHPRPDAQVNVQNDTLFAQNIPPGALISWLFEGQLLPGQNEAFLDVETTGSYQVILRQNNCADTSALQFVTGIAQANRSGQVFAFPQPFSDEVSLFWKNQTGPVRNIQFWDALGRNVQPEVLSSGATETRYSFKGWAPGLYLVRWVGPDGAHTLPLMKK